MLFVSGISRHPPYSLRPPVPFYPFLGRVPPLKIDYRKKLVPFEPLKSGPDGPMGFHSPGLRAFLARFDACGGLEATLRLVAGEVGSSSHLGEANFESVCPSSNKRNPSG